MNFELIDETAVETQKISMNVEKIPAGVGIAPKGYGTVYDDFPVLIEFYEGELRVCVWSDINQEDPTHIISLEGAKICKKNKVI